MNGWDQWSRDPRVQAAIDRLAAGVGRRPQGPRTAAEWRFAVSCLPGVVLVDLWEDQESRAFVVDVRGHDEAVVRDYVERWAFVGVLAVVRVRPPRWWHRAWAWCRRSRWTRWAVRP